ncbi:hypothetical protein EJB05_07542, partial [Eragrostis curvula]
MQFGESAHAHPYFICIIYVHDLKPRRGVPRKEQKKQASASKSKMADDDVSIAKLDIRVELIRKAEKHPDAGSLYMEEIDVGEDNGGTKNSGQQPCQLIELVEPRESVAVGGPSFDAYSDEPEVSISSQWQEQDVREISH